MSTYSRIAFDFYRQAAGAAEGEGELCSRWPALLHGRRISFPRSTNYVILDGDC